MLPPTNLSPSNPNQDAPDLLFMLLGPRDYNVRLLNAKSRIVSLPSTILQIEGLTRSSLSRQLFLQRKLLLASVLNVVGGYRKPGFLYINWPSPFHNKFENKTSYLFKSRASQSS
jgi:hypothetical protein